MCGARAIVRTIFLDAAAVDAIRAYVNARANGCLSRTGTAGATTTG
jgi:hypothetical protein